MITTEFNDYNVRDLIVPNHIYLNVSIKPEKNQKFERASFNETFTQEFIERGLDYSLAVVRFRIPISGIPYFYFKIQEGLTQTNPDLGVYALTLRHVPSATDYTEFVEFIPYDLSVPVPNPPSQNNGVQNLNSRYYNVYDVSGWLYMLNNTLSIAFQRLKNDYPATPATEAPFFLFEPTTEKLSLVTQYSLFTSGEIEIYFNNELQGFFDGFEYDLTDEVFNNELLFGLLAVYPTPVGSTTVFDNGYSAYGVAPTNPPAYLEMKSNYSTVEKWSGLRSFIFKTSLLPIRYESTNSTTIAGVISEDTILTDFNISDFYGNRKDVTFFPQGPYRLIDILSNNPLRSIDIQIFWKDKDGYIRPINVYQGDELTIKLAFITKGLSN